MIDGVEGDQLADGERLFGGLGEGGHGAVVGAQFEKVVDVAEDVARGDVAAVENGVGAGTLQAGDARRKPFESELGVACESVAGEDGGVGDPRLSRHQCIRGEGAKGVTDQDQVCRLADGRV